MMGALHPAGSLYERPVNLETSKNEHAAFRQALRREGVFVLTVRQVLLHGLATNLRYRLDLEDYAMGCLRYRAADPEHQPLADETMALMTLRILVGLAFCLCGIVFSLVLHHFNLTTAGVPWKKDGRLAAQSTPDGTPPPRRRSRRAVRRRR